MLTYSEMVAVVDRRIYSPQGKALTDIPAIRNRLSRVGFYENYKIAAYSFRYVRQRVGMSVILKDDPHAIANGIIWLMNDVDEAEAVQPNHERGRSRCRV